jgi:hypothetical protein
LAGAELKLSKRAVEQRDDLYPGRSHHLSHSTLCRRWDSRAGGKLPGLSSEIRFAKVIFVDKGQELDGWSRRH